ncbi:MAG: hypothetical protein ABJA98_29175 [Acidobacteriota bacterium]
MRGPVATPERATWYASPYKVFDNFYWLGTRQPSSWALRTSDGLISRSDYDNAYTKARLTAAKRDVGEHHPFVGGAAGVQRNFTVMTECATASRLRAGAK